MATTTSITSTYAGEFAGKYISAALLSGSTIENGLITVKPNVKFKEVLKKAATDANVIKDATCDFTATGTVTLTERILQPEFGSGLHDLLFNPATEKFEEDLENTINDAVAKWLPYVIVEDINIDITKEMTDNNQAKVSLKFKQEGDQTLDTLTFLVEE